MARRYYSSTAARTTLATGVDDTTTTLSVTAVSGWPSSFPYTLILDQDTVNEEIVEVSARSGTTLTVTRGVDGTSAVAHSSGAAVQHGVSARDFDEPNAFINGTGTVTETLLASGSVTEAKLGTGAVTSAKILDGTIVNADINASAAIAQSKIDSLTSDLASKADYPSGGTDGQALVKSGTTTAWANVGGLVLVTSQTFTSVSSVSINDCFSATYENYLLLFTKLIASGGVPGNIRLRSGGVDETGTNYTWHDLTANGGSVVSGRNTSQTSSRIISLRVDTNGSDVPVNIFRPFLATSTNYATQISYDSFASAIVSSHVGTHYIPNSYTGFTFFPASGTVSGTIRVYGYRD